MFPPLELPQSLEYVALLAPRGGQLLLRWGTDVTRRRGTQTQPVLPGQRRLQDEKQSIVSRRYFLISVSTMLPYYHGYCEAGLPSSHRSVHHSRCRSRWRIRCTRSTGTSRCCCSCCVGTRAPSGSAGSGTWPQGDLPFHSTEPPAREERGVNTTLSTMQSARTLNCDSI